MVRRTKIIIISMTMALCVVAVSLATMWAISVYVDHQYASLHDGCSPHRTNHTIVIKNAKAIPSSILANRCDTLTITNLDNERRYMAFGLHENHTPYDGIAEKVLAEGESFSVTLVQTGHFRVHDHLHDEAQATFDVQ